jgi:hypothetical protein
MATENPDFIPPDETAGHSAELPKNGSQLAGYAALR